MLNIHMYIQQANTNVWTKKPGHKVEAEKSEKTSILKQRKSTYPNNPKGNGK